MAGMAGVASWEDLRGRLRQDVREAVHEEQEALRAALTEGLRLPGAKLDRVVAPPATPPASPPASPAKDHITSALAPPLHAGNGVGNFAGNGAEKVLVNKLPLPRVPEEARSPKRASLQLASFPSVGLSSNASPRKRFSLAQATPTRELMQVKGWVPPSEVLEHSSLKYFRAEPEGRLVRIVSHPYFDYVSCTVIFLNLIFVGVELEVTLQYYQRGGTGRFHSNALQALNVMFTVIFTIEWSLRVAAYRARFFTVSARWWHAIDTILVWGAVIDMLRSLIAEDDGSGSMAKTLRIFRLARALNICRAARVASFFTELRLMALGLISASRALLWSIVFLLAVIYVFTIAFLSGVIDTFEAKGVRQDRHTKVLIQLYGSVLRSMCTLFQSISGGVDWNSAMTPLAEIARVHEVLFVLYIFVTCYCACNILTGIFVQSALKSAALEREQVIRARLEEKYSYMSQVIELFKEVDRDDSGTITWEEFSEYLHDYRVRAYFASLDLQVSEAHGLFRLLDTQENNAVDIDEFVVGCYRLKGEARGLDLATLMYENNKLSKSLNRFMGRVHLELSALDRGLKEVDSKLHLIRDTGSDKSVDDTESCGGDEAQTTRARHKKRAARKRATKDLPS